MKAAALQAVGDGAAPQPGLHELGPRDYAVLPAGQQGDRPIATLRLSMQSTPGGRLGGHGHTIPRSL